MAGINQFSEKGTVCIKLQLFLQKIKKKKEADVEHVVTVH